MKSLTLILASIALAAVSCKKECDPPAPVPTIIGKWESGQPTRKNPTITKDSIQWNDEPAYAYLSSSDSLYVLYPNQTVFAHLYYHVNATNDTLTLADRFNLTRYYRVN